MFSFRLTNLPFKFLSENFWCSSKSPKLEPHVISGSYQGLGHKLPSYLKMAVAGYFSDIWSLVIRQSCSLNYELLLSVF